MKKYIYTFLFIYITAIAYSQNNFINNTILFNPAIAGQNNLLDINLTGYTLLEQSNAPGSNGQGLSFSTPLKTGKFGIGGHLTRKEFGVFDVSKVNVFGGYHKNIGGGKLSLGTSLGITRDAVNHSDVITNGYSDVDYLPNVGLGVLWNNRFGYISASCPNTYEVFRTSYQDTLGNLENNGFKNRKIHIIAGLRLSNLSKTFVFQPSVTIVQSLDNDMFQENFLRFSGSLLIYDIFWISTSYIMDDSSFSSQDYIKFDLGYAFKKGYRIKLSYTASHIWKNTNSHSIELLLGYRMTHVEKLHNSGELLFF